MLSSCNSRDDGRRELQDERCFSRARTQLREEWRAWTQERARNRRKAATGASSARLDMDIDLYLRYLEDATHIRDRVRDVETHCGTREFLKAFHVRRVSEYREFSMNIERGVSRNAAKRTTAEIIYHNARNIIRKLDFTNLWDIKEKKKQMLFLAPEKLENCQKEDSSNIETAKRHWETSCVQVAFYLSNFFPPKKKVYDARIYASVLRPGNDTLRDERATHKFRLTSISRPLRTRVFVREFGRSCARRNTRRARARAARARIRGLRF